MPQEVLLPIGWGLLSAAGWAATWDAPRASRTLHQLAPQIADVLGRDVSVPPAAVTPWPDWVAQQRPQIAAALQEAGLPPEEADALAEEYFREQLNERGALALYDADDKDITVFPDNLDAFLAAAPNLPAGLRDDLMGCVLAHELVHAAQDQHGAFSEPVGQPPTEPKVMIAEGHAEWVAEQVCDPAASALLNLRWGQGFAWDRSLDQGYGRYILARMYLDAHANTAEKAWALLADPPSRHRLQAVLTDSSTPYLRLQRVGTLLFQRIVRQVRTNHDVLRGVPHEAEVMVSALGRDGLAASRSVFMMSQHTAIFASPGAGELSLLLMECPDLETADALRAAAQRRPRAKATRGALGARFAHDDGRAPPKGLEDLGGPARYTLVQHDTLVVLVRERGSTLAASLLRKALSVDPRLGVR